MVPVLTILYMRIYNIVYTEVKMPLSIRNPKVEKLARAVAAQYGTTVTGAIEMALEDYGKKPKPDLVEIARKISEDLMRHAKPGRRKLTKDEINAEWMD
jgi:hypothetical protein